MKINISKIFLLIYFCLLCILVAPSSYSQGITVGGDLHVEKLEMKLLDPQTKGLYRIGIVWGKDFDVKINDVHMPKKIRSSVMKYVRGNIVLPAKIDMSIFSGGKDVVRYISIKFKVNRNIEEFNMGDKGSMHNIDDMCNFDGYLEIQINIDWLTFSAFIKCRDKVTFIRCPEFGECH